VTEHVQLEILGGVTFVALQIIQVWRQNVAERNATTRDKHSTEMRQDQNAAIAEVHEAVNGGWKANQQVIRDLEAKVSKLEAIIAGERQTPEERLGQIRGTQWVSTKGPTDWHVVVNWRDDIRGLTEVKARGTFETLKRTLGRLSRGHDYPTVELRQGSMLKDFYKVEPEWSSHS
jgi:hypothetical protein